MKHRFGSHKGSDPIIQETDKGSQRHLGRNSANSNKLIDDSALIDKLKNQINRNFDNFKLLLSLENEDGQH